MLRVRTVLPSAAVGTAVLVGSLVLAPSASAQYLGSNFHGNFGVNSGSQPGPGLYVAIPFAQWNAEVISRSPAYEGTLTFNAMLTDPLTRDTYP